MKEKYIEECKIIQQNCTYSAETHHLMAVHQRKLALWFQLVPTVLAATTSSLTAAGVPGNVLPIITLLSAVAAAVTAVVNPNKQYEEHLSAAKGFTVIKHDARF